RALNDCGHALKSHSRVDVPLWQSRESSIRVRIELNENQVPNLEAPRIILVHESSARVAIRRKIDMQLGTRSAWTGVAHHPKIIGFAKADDVNLRIEIRFLKQSSPVVMRFLIEFARFARPGFVNGRVKALRWKLPTFDHKFPRPFDRFLFEVVAEAPVTEHF